MSRISFMRAKRLGTLEDVFLSHNPKDLIYQEKIPGICGIAIKEDDNTKMFSRLGNELLRHCDHINKSLNHILKNDSIVIGVLKNTEDSLYQYHIYDILRLEGNDLRDRPWIDRNKIILEMRERSENVEIIKSFDFSKDQNEINFPIILKPKNSIYLKDSGFRSRESFGSWLIFYPLGVNDHQDVIISQYYQLTGENRIAFKCFQYRNGKMTEVGRLKINDKAFERKIKTQIKKGKRAVATVAMPDMFKNTRRPWLTWVKYRPDKPFRSVRILSELMLESIIVVRMNREGSTKANNIEVIIK